MKCPTCESYMQFHKKGKESFWYCPKCKTYSNLKTDNAVLTNKKADNSPKITKYITIFILLFFDIGFVNNFHRYDKGNKIFTSIFILFSIISILIILTRKPKLVNTKTSTPNIKERQKTMNDIPKSDCPSYVDKSQNLLAWQNLIHPNTTQLKYNQKQLISQSAFVIPQHTRIVNDCIKLIKTTSTPDTFFSRYDLLLEKLTLLSNFEKYVNINEYSPTQLLNRITEEKSQTINGFIDRCWISTVNKAEALQTEKARKNRYQKFYETLLNYSDKMTEDSISHLKELVASKGVDRQIDLVNYDNASSFNVTPIEKQQTESVLFSVPDEILKLLYIKGGPLSNYTPELDNEPSLIDISLLISSEITENDEFTDIGYYPSYRNLTPSQRYIYLNWLHDISSPIAIGYVFIFYYGLERQLLFGNFDKALKAILILKKIHTNGSFQSYSSDALILACAYHKRYDLLKRFDLSKLAPEVLIYLKCGMDLKITSSDLIGIRKKVGFTNDRYIKEDINKFKEIMNDVLTKRYGNPFFSIPEDAFVATTSSCPIVLANYSLKQREAFIPDITQNLEYAAIMREILQETHEMYKIHKKKQRNKET